VSRVPCSAQHNRDGQGGGGELPRPLPPGRVRLQWCQALHYLRSWQVCFRCRHRVPRQCGEQAALARERHGYHLHRRRHLRAPLVPSVRPRHISSQFQHHRVRHLPAVVLLWRWAAILHSLQLRLGYTRARVSLGGAQREPLMTRVYQHAAGACALAAASRLFGCLESGL